MVTGTDPERATTDRGSAIHGRVKKPRFDAKRRRRLLICDLGLTAMYLFLLLIPAAYEWLIEIPSLDGLEVTSGTLLFKKTGTRGDYLTGLHTSSGSIFFTCATRWDGSTHDCLVRSRPDESLVGKEATVWWFEQPVHLWATRKRLIRLVVAGEEKVSYEISMARTKIGRESVFVGLIIGLVGFLGIAFVERMV